MSLKAKMIFLSALTVLIFAALITALFFLDINNNFLEKNIILAIIFIIIIFSLFYYLLVRSISISLRSISLALDKEDPGYINKLQRQKGEFGDMARLIARFFKEREDLSQEITIRKQAFEELTEAKNRLEEYSKKLEEALKAKSYFTSMVSHELRTPLAFIKESINLILDETTGNVNERQQEFLNIAKRNVDRLARLINDILDFQMLEAGKQELKIEENDMNEVVREVYNSASRSAQEKGFNFSLELYEGLPKIKFDRDKITQVLTNLVDNAMKFTEKGSVVIRTTRGENFVQVSVQDTGIGIKAEDLPKLFQIFEKLVKVSERKPGSTGLGLAISKEIMDKHHGKIVAESEFGKGSTFSFILPIVERRRYPPGT